MLRRLLGKSSTSVTSAAAVLAAASLASRFIGIVRDRMLSSTFGAGPELDAYYAAFRAPDLLYNLLVLGAISAGFIPVFMAVVRDKDRGDAEGWDLASRLLTVMGAGLVVFSVVGIVAAPLFVPLMTPGFSVPQRELAVTLTRIMFLSPVFLGLSSVLGGILQAHRRFLVYALAPILYNVGIIAGITLFAGPFGVTGVAVGVVAGAFLHFVLQALACRSTGFRFRAAWDLRHPGLRRIARMMVPRTAALALAQVNLVVITVVASTLGHGGITVFTLANNLQSFPVGVLGVSFAVAAFPLIAELASSREDGRFADTVSGTVRTVMFFVIPATIAFLLLRAQIVRVILGAGRFDWADTIATADTLAFFTLSLFAQALLPLVVRSFFALHDVMTPLAIGLVAVVAERLVAWRLVAAGMGAPGLALAFSVGSVINIALLWISLRRRVGSLREAAIFRAMVPMCVAGMAMAAVMQGMKTVIGGAVDMRTFLGVFAQGAAAGTAGIAAYAGLTLAMGSEEARKLLMRWRTRTTPIKEPVVVQNEDTISIE